MFNIFNYFENYFFVDALSFVISRSNKGYISSKIFSKAKKKLFYIGKKYFSYSESLSVSQFVFFKFNGDSNLSPDQIGKNVFENSSELLSQLIEVHQIQISSRSCPKVGKIRFCIVEVEWKIFVWIRVDGSFLQLLQTF